MKKSFVLFSILLLIALVLVACGGDGETVEVTRIVEVTRVVETAAEGGGEAEAVTFAGGGDTLATVQERGILNCGSNAALPGFANVEADGSYTGFDYDYCRAVAAATLGDSEAVEVTATTGTSRFPVLQSGDVDVLIIGCGSRARLYRNDVPKKGSWLMVSALKEGGRGYAYGSWVTVRAGDRRWSRRVHPACSYLSSADPRLHFGLGAAERVDVEVRWPDGSVTELEEVETQRLVTIEKGRGERRLPVARRR